MKKIFKNKRVTIMGLGLHGGGVGAAKFFYGQGAKLLITDLKNRSQLKEPLQKLKGLPIKFVLGKHREEDFINTDLIIKNPAVSSDSPYLKIARDHNIPIRTDIEIFFDLVPSRQIIGITGTKGKSTTATLCYLFLKSKYPDTILAGNIGISPLGIISKVDKNTKVVLELSSFGLEGLKKSPHIAVITALFPDHLDRYKNFRDYLKAKEPIFKYQKKSDILILNYNDPIVKKIAAKARSKVHFFTQSEALTAKKKYKNQVFLTGLRNSNISAALVVAEIFKIPKKNIEEVFSKFKGVSHRQEIVAVRKGAKYVNDTAATTPQSAILAIDTFKNKFLGSKIILIAGGTDKNLNYKNLAEKIKKDVNFLILLPGTASDKIKKGINGFDNVYLAKSMREAVRKASEYAQKGDVVLLSPGAASFTSLEISRKRGKDKRKASLMGFNLFKNEFDRGEQFIELVKQLK